MAREAKTKERQCGTRNLRARYVTAHVHMGQQWRCGSCGKPFPFGQGAGENETINPGKELKVA
jgi:hypothetical protein